MSSLPDYVEVLVEGYGEEFDPSIEITEMERGFAKQRVKNTFVTMKLNLKLLIRGKANVEAFDDWYFNDIKRIGFFTMLHPRKGQLITCRFFEAKLGPIVMVQPGFASVTRDCTVEYIRQ
ncbi:P17 [Xanthomonas phage phiL7]|uniref:p17 n=1 Tax=Xanthomonas phage phiL7 TaxID=538979 RepID=C4ML17_9CAUD|nr:virion structural protein [Xanthomonas phage phiL7]ACE75757.1 P17 [Xanthomonas phage phiL7]